MTSHLDPCEEIVFICVPERWGLQSLCALIWTKLWQQLISWITASAVAEEGHILTSITASNIRQYNQQTALATTFHMKSISGCCAITVNPVFIHKLLVTQDTVKVKEKLVILILSCFIDVL